MPDKSSAPRRNLDEYIATPEHVEYMVFPRLLALSEAVWSPAAGKDYEDFSVACAISSDASTSRTCVIAFPARWTRGLLHDDGRSHDRRSHLDGRGELIQLHARRERSDGCLSTHEAPLQIRYRGAETTLNVLVTAPVGRRSAVYSAHFLRRLIERRCRRQPRNRGCRSRSSTATFTTVRDIKSGTPVASGTTSALDLEQFGGRRSSVCVDGYVKVETDSFYRFAVESDDGSVLSIDDEVVIENDGNHAPQLVTGHIPLRQGFHKSACGTTSRRAVRVPGRLGSRRR